MSHELNIAYASLPIMTKESDVPSGSGRPFASPPPAPPLSPLPSADLKKRYSGTYPGFEVVDDRLLVGTLEADRDGMLCVKVYDKNTTKWNAALYKNKATKLYS